ncbi:MAG: EpsG family protein [Prolixibacteraceae bacterium]
MLTLLVFTIILLYQIEVFSKLKTVKTFFLLLSILIFFVSLYYITNNSDWLIYEAMFHNNFTKSDILFNTLSEFYRGHGYSYISVYRVHIILIGLGFFYFLKSTNNRNFFVTILIYLIFQLVPISNQIRFYLAFSFFLVSIIQLYLKNNRTLYIIFTLLSLSSHLGILLLLPFSFIFNKMDVKSIQKEMIKLSVLLTIILLLFYYVGLTVFTRFALYFSNTYISSIKGGIYTIGIWVLWLFLLHFLHKYNYNKYPKLIEGDRHYRLLYKLSFYSIIFIPSSTLLQILCHRYVMSFIIIWLTFFFYSLKYYPKLKTKLVLSSFMLTIVFITIFYYYFLPEMLIGISRTEQLMLIFESNTLLK